MRPRFVGRLGLADAITVANAVLGLVAAVVATRDPHLAARLILLAAMGDGLDGIVARRRGGTPVGESLDALSDVVTFGAAPALLVVSLATDAGSVRGLGPDATFGIAVGVAAVYLSMVVVRLGLYTVYDAAEHSTLGVPASLPAIAISGAVLVELVGPLPVLVGTLVLSYMMIVEVRYPDLLPRDVFLMGVVQGLAVLVPRSFGRAFPYALLILSLAYLMLAPTFYWRDVDPGPATPGERPEGKRS